MRSISARPAQFGELRSALHLAYHYSRPPVVPGPDFNAEREYEGRKSQQLFASAGLFPPCTVSAIPSSSESAVNPARRILANSVVMSRDPVTLLDAAEPTEASRRRPARAAASPGAPSRPARPGSVRRRTRRCRRDGRSGAGEKTSPTVLMPHPFFGTPPSISQQMWSS